MLLLLTALTFCPDATRHEPISFEEAVIFLEQNPLPAYLIDRTIQDQSAINLLAFVFKIEKENIKSYRNAVYLAYPGADPDQPKANHPHV